MIVDPSNPKVAMDHHGRLYHVAHLKMDADGNPAPEWVLMSEINFKGDFRRPEW